MISAVFTLTPDLHAAYPARAARELGWLDVPLLCACEIAVPGVPRGIVRVLLHVEMPDGRPARNIYLGAARALRPDR